MHDAHSTRRSDTTERRKYDSHTSFMYRTDMCPLSALAFLLLQAVTCLPSPTLQHTLSRPVLAGGFIYFCFTTAATAAAAITTGSEK